MASAGPFWDSNTLKSHDTMSILYDSRLKAGTSGEGFTAIAIPGKEYGTLHSFHETRLWIHSIDLYECSSTGSNNWLQKALATLSFINCMQKQLCMQVMKANVVKVLCNCNAMLSLILLRTCMLMNHLLFTVKLTFSDVSVAYILSDTMSIFSDVFGNCYLPQWMTRKALCTA